MHALIISAIRLKYPEMASNEGAAEIASLSAEQMSEIKSVILDRLNIVKPEVRQDAENEIDQFIDWWKFLAAQGKPLRYYVYGTERYNRLMNYYGQACKDTEKATLIVRSSQIGWQQGDLGKRKSHFKINTRVSMPCNFFAVAQRISGTLKMTYPFLLKNCRKRGTHPSMGAPLYASHAFLKSNHCLSVKAPNRCPSIF